MTTTKTAARIPDTVRKHLAKEKERLSAYTESPLTKKFRTWLDSLGMTYEAFARKTGLSYNTVFRWGRDRKPSALAVAVIRRHFPDCPFVTEQ